MRGARSSMNLLRSLVGNSAVANDGGAKGGFDLFGSLLRIGATEEGQRLTHQRWQSFSSRSFSSDVEKPPPPVEEEDTKSELGRWWQKFSEQTLGQAANARKTNKDSGDKQWSILKGKQSSGQELQDSSSKEGGSNSWFIPKVETQDEQPESFDKETISRWFSPKAADESSTEQEGQEITSKEVGARWLASSKEKSSTEEELSDLSSVPWFGLNKETPASERERLEVSMQRFALMSKDNNQGSDFMFLPPKNELLRKYFHWENLASPEKHKVTLTKVRKDFQIHKTDCGSSQVQIALLTTKIKYMTKHMETNRKDYHSRKGLEAMVQRRRKILKYLRRKDWDAYCEVITKLGLRDNVMDQQKR
ncbi:unnamed protein product [Calypogeia fissa]